MGGAGEQALLFVRRALCGHRERDAAHEVDYTSYVEGCLLTLHGLDCPAMGLISQRSAHSLKCPSRSSPALCPRLQIRFPRHANSRFCTTPARPRHHVRSSL
jgi:hypothetical protein